MNRARVLPFPDRDDRDENATPRLPNEAEARAAAAAGLRAVRELAGQTIEEWAHNWSAALGLLITPAEVAAYEDPLGPKPPSHWALVAFMMGGPAAIEVSSRLLLS